MRFWDRVAGVPWMWKPFVWIDLVMGVLFGWAYVILRPGAEEIGGKE